MPENGTLVDVIGRPAVHDGVRFVPILYDDPFADNPYLYLDDIDRLPTIPNCFTFTDDVANWPTWWAKSRLIDIFGFQPPVNCELNRPLNCPFAAVLDVSEPELSFVPMLLASAGLANSYATIQFREGTPKETKQRLASAFLELLLKSPSGLGVFVEYHLPSWDDEGSYEAPLYRVSCDGASFDVNFVGYLRPRSETDDDIDAYNAETFEEGTCCELWRREYPLGPFSLPRKRRCNNRMN